MEGERLERLGYLTTEFQHSRLRRDNAVSVLLLCEAALHAPPPRDERGVGASSNSPRIIRRKRENADKHDRIKAATNFNAD